MLRILRVTFFALSHLISINDVVLILKAFSPSYLWQDDCWIFIRVCMLSFESFLASPFLVKCHLHSRYKN